jgi:hypothetical protein
MNALHAAIFTQEGSPDELVGKHLERIQAAEDKFWKGQKK